MRKAIHIASLLALGATVSAAAQHPVHTPAPHGRPSAAAAKPADRESGSKASEEKRSFGGIAKKLGTTPQALEAAYDAAKGTNPDLTRGQFVAANVLAHNLGEKNPAITTQAILAGLKSGKSIGQTLHSLGLSDKEADEAERAADKEAKEAERAADKDATADKDSRGDEKKPNQ